MWRHRFGGGFGPVVRRNTKCMEIHLLSLANRCIRFINLLAQIFVVQLVLCFWNNFVVILMLSRREIVPVSFALQFIRRTAKALGHCNCEMTLAQGHILYPNFPVSYRTSREIHNFNYMLFIPLRYVGQDEKKYPSEHVMTIY